MRPHESSSPAFDAAAADAAAHALRTEGYAKLKAPADLLAAFDEVCRLYPGVHAGEKKDFSFVEGTDGFIPFGLEYSESPERPVLCERFCYWPRNAAMHRLAAFSGTSFYAAVSEYERRGRGSGDALLQAVFRAERYAHPFCAIESSYLQFCAYDAALLERHAATREYLQDPHEDGHLLSFIRPTGPGLVLFPHGRPVQPEIAPDEIVVLPGSLLAALSDGIFPATWHAVENTRRPGGRMSMMYFVNPPLDAPIRSFRRDEPIVFRDLANERHISFGNMNLVE